MSGTSYKFLIILGLLLAGSVLGGSGCQEDPSFLLASQRTRIDTTVAKQVALLGPVMDSLCDQRFDAMVEGARDSIMKVKLEEIRKIIGE